MKKLALCLFVAVIAAGCAVNYDVTDSMGHVIRSTTKPQLDAQGYYVYKTPSGEVGRINKMRVRKIETVSPGDPMSRPFDYK